MARKPAPEAAGDPLTPRAMGRFERDVSRMRKRGKNMDVFKSLIETLCERRPLPPALRDHPLKGDWKGWRDCHIAPDWLLIDRTTETELLLGRTGTHSDLFG